jgi:hypothetical protein
MSRGLRYAALAAAALGTAFASQSAAACSNIPTTTKNIPVSDQRIVTINAAPVTKGGITRCNETLGNFSVSNTDLNKARQSGKSFIGFVFAQGAQSCDLYSNASVAQTVDGDRTRLTFIVPDDIFPRLAKTGCVAANFGPE